MAVLLWRHMKRTTIMLPPRLKAQAEREASKAGVSLGAFVRQSLASALERRDGGSAGDPLLSDHLVFDDAGPADVAENHDDYLYGDKA